MTSQEHKQVVIAGGGIGGLAAAVACAQRGVPVQLLERAAQLSEVGAVGSRPNLMRKGTPVASDLASFLTQSSCGMSSSQPRKVTAKASLTASVTGYWVETGEFIRVFPFFRTHEVFQPVTDDSQTPQP